MSDDCKARLLIIDDESEIRRVLVEFLSTTNECAAASSAEEALALLSNAPFDLIISDVAMSGMSGLEMLPRALQISPETVIIMISGAQTIESAIDALRAGAFDYLMKPFDLQHVELAVNRALEHRSLLHAKRCYENYLEELIDQRTAELNQTLDTLEDSYRTTLEALVSALETRDADTYGHSERVVSFSVRIGRELGLDRDSLRSLEFGALLHDIGKIGIPDAILRKPGALSGVEWKIMKDHPSLGEKILSGIGFLAGAARVVGEHHEKWDGTGYPSGLAGVEIDFNARIFAVADAFDAMISERVYRSGRSYEFAAAELDRCSGTHFDPQVVAAFHKIPCDDWKKLRELSRSERSGELNPTAIGSRARSAPALAADHDVTSDWIRKLQQIVEVNRGHISVGSGW
ncbi:MAG: cyclic di-GMP phosphodiesterase [Acidobacteriota bacterium]|jgi:putative nucleotidyltransferase with HDIG domain|nr:cyclic di-GMP phosphodiesterase [Acidobacteriota bacterium]